MPKDKAARSIWMGETVLMARLLLTATAKQSADKPKAMRTMESISVLITFYFQWYTCCHEVDLVGSLSDELVSFAQQVTINTSQLVVWD